MLVLIRYLSVACHLWQTAVLCRVQGGLITHLCAWGHRTHCLVPSLIGLPLLVVLKMMPPSWRVVDPIQAGGVCPVSVQQYLSRWLQTFMTATSLLAHIVCVRVLIWMHVSMPLCSVPCPNSCACVNHLWLHMHGAQAAGKPLQSWCEAACYMAMDAHQLPHKTCVLAMQYGVVGLHSTSRPAQAGLSRARVCLLVLSHEVCWPQFSTPPVLQHPAVCWGPSFAHIVVTWALLAHPGQAECHTKGYRVCCNRLGV